MSISQDILDDLANTTGETPEQLMQASPNVVTPVSKSPGVVEANNFVDQDQTPITDEVRAKLLNPQTQLVTIRDDIQTVETLGELHKEIADNAVVSAADAVAIAPHLEGFNKLFHPKSFTTVPSQTNFFRVESYLREQIKVRQEKITIQYGLLSDALSDAEESFETYREFYSSELIESLTQFQAEALKWKSDTLHMDKQIIPFGGRDLNLASDILDFDAMEGQLDRVFDHGAFDLYKDMLKSFKDVMEKYLTASQLLKVINGTGSVDDLVSAGERAEAYGVQYSPLDLINAFTSPYAITFLKDFEVAVKAQLEKLGELEKEAQIDKNNFQQTLKFVLTNGETFDKASLYAHYYAETIDTMRRLFVLAQGFLTYFAGEK